MDLRIPKWTSVLFLFLIAVPSRAERVYTWNESVATAKQKNPDLLAAQRGLESRKASYKESFNSVFPSLSLSESYTRAQNDTPGSNRWSARGTVSLTTFYHMILNCVQ
jgi:outer membrane protein TolC